MGSPPPGFAIRESRIGRHRSADRLNNNLRAPINSLTWGVMLAVGASYGLALLSMFLRRLSDKKCILGFASLTVLMALVPLLVPVQWYNLPRAIVAALAAFLWLKAWDAVAGHQGNRTLSVALHLRQMLNFGSLTSARTHGDRSTTPSHDCTVGVLVWMAAFCAAGVSLCVVFKISWTGAPFIVEHTAKVSAIATLILSSMNLHAALWRSAGVRSLHSPASAFVACSPADFWRRWNRPVGEWLYCHVFRRTGTAGCRAGAILLTFAVSGLLHEYIVGMLTGRVTGYPTAFFLLQGLAVTATFRVRITGPWWLSGVVLTIVFNACSSTLLFVPFDQAMPFYQNPVPRGLLLR